MAARIAIIGLAVGASVALTIPHRVLPWLVWNSTASAPRGLYAVQPTHRVWREELVLVTPPAWAAQLAAARGYLPLGVPLVKRVAALSGDQVCGKGGQVWINAHLVARRLVWDSQRRTLPWWQGCRTLAAGQELLLNSAPASFDGRYFGPVLTARNLGRLEPLWTF